jgi:N-acetylated-alpha-linked acidic dipeptidase
MKRFLSAAVVLSLLAPTSAAFAQQASPAAPTMQGFHDGAAQTQLEKRFMAVPSAQLAEQHLKTLTQAPHLAGTPEDKATADYVAAKFREAGLDTRIEEYQVWLDYPGEILVEASAPNGMHMVGPTKEHIDGEVGEGQDDPRVIPAFNGGSASGDVTGDAIYANYGRPEDFKKLEDLGVDIKGKIVVVRYGANFRGVKAFIAEQKGAAGVIIYSDPWDDGYFRGDSLPKGPYRPDSGIQRGSVQYMFEYPGDATTPGIGATADLPDSKRIDPAKAVNLCKIPVTPLSYRDATPILENLAGPETPRDWQGALPFTYHVGPGPVKVHLKLEHKYALRTIWDVIGTIKGSQNPDEWVVAGNHRDGWVYGAIDPNSGTTAMLEAVHGLGDLLKTGWKPKRTIIFGSWDAEEEGLIGSTEYAETFANELSSKAVAYFNTDVAVNGPNFGASSVPSLKQFLREVTKAVPAPKGGTVYENWRDGVEKRRKESQSSAVTGAPTRQGSVPTTDVPVGDLGSGSDYTAFLQHLGIPSSDIGSGGGTGVYHSAFDSFAFFKKFVDPTFEYEQEMARVFGVEILRMAQADVLPMDYEEYGKEIRVYIETAKKRVDATKWQTKPDFTAALAAADSLAASAKALEAAKNVSDADRNRAFMQAERAFLNADGLPRRPFFKHSIYAPGEYTGYAAVVIPGVNEAIDANNADITTKELAAVTAAIQRAADILRNPSAARPVTTQGAGSR